VASQSWVREEVSKFWKEIGGDDLTSPLATSLSEALAFRSHTLKVPETSVPLPEIFCEDNSIAFLGLIYSVPLYTSLRTLATRNGMRTAFQVSQRLWYLPPGLPHLLFQSHPSPFLFLPS
jgi:hypothetical protein